MLVQLLLLVQLTAQYELPQDYIGRVTAASDMDYAAQRAYDAARRAQHKARVVANLHKQKLQQTTARMAPAKPVINGDKRRVALPVIAPKRVDTGLRVVVRWTGTETEEHTAKNGSKWYRDIEVQLVKPVFDVWDDAQLIETDIVSMDDAKLIMERWKNEKSNR